LANLNVKNIPADVYERLKRRASDHRRSLNGEILVLLEQGVKSSRVDPVDFLRRLKAVQERMNGKPLTDEVLEAAKSEGRA